jgi:hypothetical protein
LVVVVELEQACLQIRLLLALLNQNHRQMLGLLALLQIHLQLVRVN